MPKASDHKASQFVKVLFIGNSGAGKTGALCPLVLAGYNLKIIDLDSGLDALVNFVSEADPKLLDKIEYVTYRDKIKMSNSGPKVVGAPTTYVNVLQALESWPDDNSDPSEWGNETIFVLDSLTNLGRAAFQWAKATNPATKDPRQWYKTAQDLVEDLIANLTSDSFKTNVIVISHIELTENSMGMTKGYASSIGKALGPKLPRFFNTLLLSETKGSGSNVKRMIKTAPTAMIDVKNPAPMRIEAEYEIKDGMAKIFQKLRDEQ